MNPQVVVYGCSIDNLSFEEAVQRILEHASGSNPSFAVTPNVDHLVQLRSDSRLRAAYDDAALRLADGMPLIWAARLQRTPLKAKVSGSDLVDALCRGAENLGLRVFFFGGLPGAAASVAEIVTSRYPRLTVAGTLCPPHGFEDSADHERILETVRQARPNLLFVALGAPKQELWIHDHLHELGIPMAIGVGAALDFLSGQTKRAPPWMQSAGLEWFHRLLHDPVRLARRYLWRDLPFFGELLRLSFRRLRPSRRPAVNETGSEGPLH